ncbi:MAG: response regulator [Nitrososphaera sp.]
MVEGSTKHRLLVVDDEPDIANVLKKGLENEGFDVKAFTDPVEALNGIGAGQYDMAILDIRMPKMNGFELYRKLKARDEKIKICFITAFEIYHEEFKKVFPRVRISCFVTKPITISALAKTIREEIELKDEIESTQQTPAQKDRDTFL